MTAPIWQLDTPVSAIVFDCDGTLNKIEGIDYLAEVTGVSEKVKKMTADAMTHTGLNPELYQARLDLVNPSQQQIIALGQEYFAQRVPDVDEVMQLLLRLQKSIYVVSAGLSPAVKIFGALLNIPAVNIFAVDITFDEQGNYVDFEKTSPLIDNSGKKIIVANLKKHHPHIIHIGDGLNDLITRDMVTRFIGYGGVFYRENIAAQCHYYINTLTLAALLPLILTKQEAASLNPEESILFKKGLQKIYAGEVKYPD